MSDRGPEGAAPAAAGPVAWRQANLLRDLPDAADAERSETLAAGGGVRIERLVSRGQVSPPGFWYDQCEDEWVALLAGAARLEIAGEPAPRELAPGDWLLLPAHCRHRLTWTDPDRESVWLAVHFSGGTP